MGLTLRVIIGSIRQTRVEPYQYIRKQELCLWTGTATITDTTFRRESERRTSYGGDDRQESRSHQEEYYNNHGSIRAYTGAYYGVRDHGRL